MEWDPFTNSMFVLPGYCWGEERPWQPLSFGLLALVCAVCEFGRPILAFSPPGRSCTGTGSKVIWTRQSAQREDCSCTYWNTKKSWNWQNSQIWTLLMDPTYPEFHRLSHECERNKRVVHQQNEIRWNFFNNPLLSCVSGGPEGRRG